MKKVVLATCAILACLCFFPNSTYAQHTFRTTTSGSIIGYMEYLPADYNTNSDKYPVLIFLHGADERGANSTDPAVLQTTINLATKLGPPLHVKNGEQFPFILITPQLKTSYGSWPASYVKEVIDHCKTYLRIDEKRIHITGLSMGGHGTWTCIESMPSLYASAVPVCGAYNVPAKACGIAAENVAVWAFHGDADPVVSYTRTTNMVNAINACAPAPSPLAKATIYAGIQHNAWYRAYFLTNNYHTPNFYQWIMLQTRTKRSGNNIPIANAGADKTIVLPTNNVVIAGSGSDAGGSIAAYTWSQLQGPSKATLSGATSASATASGLVNGTYVFKLTVTDNGGLIDSDFVKVTVSGTGSNIPPVVNAGVDKTITLPSNSTTISGTATDSDGISSYAWTKVSGGAATLSGANTSNLSATGMAAGNYVFRLTVTDTKGASGTDDVAVFVNNAPTVSAGSDVTITLPTNSVSIQGSASDADGSISTYAWTKLSGGAATLSGATSSRLTASGLVEGSYTFRLTVQDNSGASKSDDVKVTVSPSSGGNVLPVASAGSDKLVSLPTTSLSISGSATDGDGTIVSYNWQKLSGNTVTLGGATTPTLNVSSLTAGSYLFRLTVTDNSGATDTDDVAVTVNTRPTISAGTDLSITLPTNSASFQATASDVDGTIATYSWTMLNGVGGTLSGTTTSKLTASALTEGLYVFRLTVTDDKGAASIDDVRITVLANPTGNAAPKAFAGADQLISLPTNTITIVGSGTDADGTISSYSWSKLSGGAATLNGAGTSSLSTSGLVAGTYVFRLTVRDDDGSTGTDDVTVTVNNPPTVSVGTDYVLTLPVNSTSIQGTASDSDGSIVAYSWKMTTGTVATLTGTTTSKLSASGLVEGPYVFRLFATDNHGITKFDDVKITVKSAAAGSTIPNASPTANAGPDRLISPPSNSITLSGSGADSDGTITSYSWTKISGGAATLSGASTNSLTASSLVEGTYTFRLAVTDNNGATDVDDVVVVVNAPPVVSVGSDFNIMLPTNSLSVQGVVSDPDGTIVSYQWKMTTGTVATLSGTTTSKLTATGLVEGPYVFRLFATDNHGASKFDDVKIWVKPANQPPVVSLGADISLLLPTNSLSIQGTASDPDGSIVSYRWQMTTGTVATLAGTNTSKLTATGLVQGSYVFRLWATDNHGAAKFDDVMVFVKPVTTTGTIYEIESLATAELPESEIGNDLNYDNDEYWKNKKVTIYDASGKEAFSGLWRGSNYTTVLESGKMYIFNILESGKKVRQGKIIVNR